MRTVKLKIQVKVFVIVRCSSSVQLDIYGGAVFSHFSSADWPSSTKDLICLYCFNASWGCEYCPLSSDVFDFFHQIWGSTLSKNQGHAIFLSFYSPPLYIRCLWIQWP